MSSGLLVPPNVGVDRLVADRELAVKAQVAGDLLWAPVGLKLLLHQGKVGLCEVWFRRDRERRPFVLSMALLGR